MRQDYDWKGRIESKRQEKDLKEALEYLDLGTMCFLGAVVFAVLTFVPVQGIPAHVLEVGRITSLIAFAVGGMFLTSALAGARKSR